MKGNNMINTNILKTLGEFGMTENETKVYLEAIKHDFISPFKLAKLVGIPRTTVYDIMTTLSLKGLIELKTSQGLEKQQTWIKAKNPSTLRDIIWERRRQLSKLEVDIVDILPDLKEPYSKNQSNINFQFYSGTAGAKYIFDKVNSLSNTAEVFVWDSLMPMDTLGRKTINSLVAEELKNRKKGNLRPKTIIHLNERNRHVLSYQYRRDPDYLNYHEFRYIDSPSFHINQDIYLVADHIYITCAQEDEAWGLSLKSKLLYRTLKSIFELNWNLAHSVTEQFIRGFGDNEFLNNERKKKY